MDKGFDDPSRVPNGKLKPVFTKLFASYSSTDPAVRRKAALHSTIFKILRQDKRTPITSAIGEISNGALPFAMRACEYSTTTDPEPKTHIITLRDLRFYKNGREIFKNRSSADTILITFTDQKNGVKNEQITRQRGTNPNFCPVRIWARIFDRIFNYPGTTLDTPVNAVLSKGKVKYITSAAVSKQIKRAAVLSNSGLNIDDVSPHSIRATFATMLFHEGHSLSDVKLMGRWRSDAFLLYIRKNTLFVDISTSIQNTENMRQVN